MVHGEPGVGKTALLEDAVAAAEDFRVVRTSGVEGEMQLDHAALQQRCAPILAFGLSAGQAPSPFLVGLAALGLLSDAAEQRPAPACGCRPPLPVRWSGGSSAEDLDALDRQARTCAGEVLPRQAEGRVDVVASTTSSARFSPSSRSSLSGQLILIPVVEIERWVQRHVRQLVEIREVS